MALISPDGLYLRVEEIKTGKNLIQFFARVYKERTAAPIQDSTFVAPYDINGANPFVQAYNFLLAEKFVGWKSDAEKQTVKTPKKRKA